MPRLFFALPIPETMVDTLAPAMEGGPEGLRWIHEDDLHCTLRFVGEVDRHRANDLIEALQGFEAPPIEARVDGVGVFDHRRRGALWARLAPKAPLEALHNRLDRLCVQCGLAPERRAYLPHITLARWSGGRLDARPWAERWAGLSSDVQRFDRFTLFRSDLTTSGPIYRIVGE